MKAFAVWLVSVTVYHQVNPFVAASIVNSGFLSSWRWNELAPLFFGAALTFLVLQATRKTVDKTTEVLIAKMDVLLAALDQDRIERVGPPLTEADVRQYTVQGA